MKRFTPYAVVFAVAFTTGVSWAAEALPKKKVSETPSALEPTAAQLKKSEKAPSFEQKKWTGTQTSFELTSEYNYIAPAEQNMGLNHSNENVGEHFFAVQQGLLRRTLLAFLVQAGWTFQQHDFDSTDASLVPQRLDILNSFVALDFRWSRQDMVRIQADPGLYSDFSHINGNAVNAPISVGYTRVSSLKFQWAVGFNINTWRREFILPGGGFRWQINDRWKLKFFMPNPTIEYKAAPNLHVYVGGDFRGNTYRVSPGFGEARGVPALNNALVNYQEIRVGPGLSWNIKPLVALNLQGGYMLGREFDFHNNGIVLRSGKAPFVNIGIRVLFKLAGDETPIPPPSQIRFRDMFKYL